LKYKIGCIVTTLEPELEPGFNVLATVNVVGEGMDATTTELNEYAAGVRAPEIETICPT
jgi:hypothetical protein